jgi:hypothetical protein
VEVGTVDYAQGSDGVPIPKRLNTRSLSCDYTEIGPGKLETVTGKPFREETYEVSFSGFGTTPDNEFRASFFGLPDFREQTRRPISGTVATTFFVLAFSGLAASLFLRHLASRRLPGGDEHRKVGDLGISSKLSVE